MTLLSGGRVVVSWFGAVEYSQRYDEERRVIGYGCAFVDLQNFEPTLFLYTVSSVATET